MAKKIFLPTGGGSVKIQQMDETLVVRLRGNFEEPTQNKIENFPNDREFCLSFQHNLEE